MNNPMDELARMFGEMARQISNDLRAMAARDYHDHKGRVLFVTDGGAKGRTWFVAYKTKRGSLRRFRSLYTPTRRTRMDAQADLNALAAKRGWEEAERD
jgi:hypothetical protein